MTSFRSMLLCVVLAGIAAPGTLGAENADAQRPPTRAIGPRYEAGAIHRWLWGTDYRALWTAPVHVEVLDLSSVGGGLTPVRDFGGSETKVLALHGADGRDYTFRSVDKDPVSLVPEELRDTWVRDLAQDQIVGCHPVSFFVVDELMEAAGILHVKSRLVVMPDDERLGAYRQEFAGVIGQFLEYPQGRSARNPGFQRALRILNHAEFYPLMAASPDERPDVRAFLKARLFDMMLGDFDRHRRQWRWAKFEGRDAWEPIPEDRDTAFSRYEGVVLGVARPHIPRLQNYDDTYPGMKGLTWLGNEQDRRFLAEVERPLFQEVATELQSQITDAVIARAVRRLPAEFVEVDGKRLEHDLRGRRDGLRGAADEYYAHLADKVKVHLTAQSEVVDVERVNGHEVVVRAWVRDTNGERAGEPFYQRTLNGRETDEVQIYLGGGEDRVTTVGEPNEIDVRVIGQGARSVVDDTRGGGTRLSTDGGPGRLLAGPGSHVDRRKYVAPPVPAETPWLPPRDWGRDTFVRPWLYYGSDIGPLVGAVMDTRGFGFRKDPYASRHLLRAGWAFGESTLRADYRAEFRPENRGWRWGWYGFASGTEASRYFGLGNETSDGGDPQSDFFNATQNQFALTPSVTVPLLGRLTFSVGPTVKYGSNRRKDESTLLKDGRPYGYGDFGEVGATGQLELDSREESTSRVVMDGYGYPRRGAHVQVGGQVFPGVWDVEETFGSVKGNAAVYLSPSSERAPTLALRVGGDKVFGRYPYFEAAYIGGDLGGFGESAGDSPVRGLPRHRYAGDASLYGSADLRLPVSRFRFILPGTWGVLGFVDSGRVYLDGEDSDQWHNGYGGGLWFAWLDRANVISATYARSDGDNKVYVRAGFAF
jgi:hypothetical protein